MEQVKSIYYLLIFSLESLGDSSGEGTHTSPEGRIEEQGLAKLRHFLDGTKTTTSDKSYLRRFLSKAFYGFANANPNDEIVRERKRIGHPRINI